jgi:hypothetical protein
MEDQMNRKVMSRGRAPPGVGVKHYMTLIQGNGLGKYIKNIQWRI